MATLSSNFLGRALKVSAARPALPARAPLVTRALFTSKKAAPKKVRFKVFFLFPFFSFVFFSSFPRSFERQDAAFPRLNRRIGESSTISRALAGKGKSRNGRKALRDASEKLNFMPFSRFIVRLRISKKKTLPPDASFSAPRASFLPHSCARDTNRSYGPSERGLTGNKVAEEDWRGGGNARSFCSREIKLQRRSRPRFFFFFRFSTAWGREGTALPPLLTSSPPLPTPPLQPPLPLSSQAATGSKKVLTAGKDIKATQFTIGLSSKKGKTVSIGFTKSNELFVGRMAMLGIASSIIGEVLTGKGALAQLGFETGLPIFDLDGLILAVIGFNLIAALLPAKGKFIPDEEELTERPAGALQSSKVSLATPGAFFGIKGFGFTKENELFVGRMAQLGFAASLIGEGITGKGFLGQLGFETGIPLIDVDFFLAVSIAFTLFAAINEGSGKFVDEE